MFPAWGFVDTLAEYSGLNHTSGLIADTANPYAAMPSLHSMDAFIVGVVMFGVCRAVWARILWLLWPAWVWFSVIGTGNHYWLDVVAGVAIAVAHRRPAVPPQHVPALARARTPRERAPPRARASASSTGSSRSTPRPPARSCSAR